MKVKFKVALLLMAILMLLLVPQVMAQEEDPGDGNGGPIPDLSSLTMYGVPWMAVGASLKWAFKKYFRVDAGIQLFCTAGWAVAGYIFVTYLPTIESFWPDLPNILPVILTAILIFGSVLGFQPGETMAKASAYMTTRRKR